MTRLADGLFAGEANARAVGLAAAYSYRTVWFLGPDVLDRGAGEVGVGLGVGGGAAGQVQDRVEYLAVLCAHRLADGLDAGRGSYQFQDADHVEVAILTAQPVGQNHGGLARVVPECFGERGHSPTASLNLQSQNRTST